MDIDALDNPTKTPLEDIDSLSREFILRFYRHDISWCLSCCVPDVTYLGSSYGNSATGLVGLLSVMSEGSSKYPPMLATDMSISSRPLFDGLAVLSLASFHLTPNQASNNALIGKKRATLLWQQSSIGPRLEHIHFSTQFPTVKRSEQSPGASYGILLSTNELFEQLTRHSYAFLRDTSGTMHRIFAGEVRSIEAKRQCSIMHCLNRDVVVRKGFTEIVGCFGDEMVTVHRSYAVNPAFVRSFSRNTIVLDDETQIPISQRRAKEVCRQLEKAMDADREPTNPSKAVLLPSEVANLLRTSLAP